jgi:hypothetical protein
MVNIWLLWKGLLKGSKVGFTSKWYAFTGEVVSHRIIGSEIYTLVVIENGLMFEVQTKNLVWFRS